MFVLLEEIAEHPFTGTGKPEALKHELAGKWSRRINQEHRLIYEVKGDEIKIVSLKGHYKVLYAICTLFGCVAWILSCQLEGASSESLVTYYVVLNAAYTGKYYKPAMYCEAMYNHSITALLKGAWVEVVK